MTAKFEQAIGYVLDNEGVDSNDPEDRGGRTRFGITAAVAKENGLDVRTLTLYQAKAIYRRNYWKFDAVDDQRVATKMLDVVVNCGVDGGTKIIQRAIGAPSDGIFGPASAAAVNKLMPDWAIEQISFGVSDHYVEICRKDLSQLVFLKGWMRRAVKRPSEY